MLVELSVKNIALIEDLHLKFGSGLVVLTGETGAGKSIILDALGLLVGNRATTDLIRRGCDSAFVEGLFTISGREQAIAAVLEEWGQELEDEQLLVSRELLLSGRTTCRVNGRMVTVQMLRQLGRLLLQQHGQHDQQGLLRSDEQLGLLDAYAKHEQLLLETAASYRSWREAHRHLESLSMDEQERTRQLDMLQFQIDEIEQARLVPGEEEPLREERKRLQHLERIVSHVESASDNLDGTSGISGVLSQLADAVKEVSAAAAYDAGLGESLTLLETAQVHAEEASRALGAYLMKLDADPNRLETIDSRLAEIRALERKYGPSVDDVIAYQEDAIRRRKQLEEHEQKTTEAEAELKQAKQRLENSCRALHESRRRAAAELSEKIALVLRQLDIPSAVFRIDVEPAPEGDHFTARGWDTVSYLFSANRGEEPKPLSRIGSGGELSRTLLAMKSVLSEVDEVDSLVFDEIDTGVSGSAASRIADCLSQLGRRGQVLCVTHAASIAATATTHFEIVKEELDSATRTRVEELDDSGRVREIARLLGSTLAEETAAEHARALLDSRKHLSA